MARSGGSVSGGGIKSVQRGTVTVINSTAPGVVTIAAVNPAKSMVNFLGSSGSTQIGVFPYLTLDNATTLSARLSGNSGGFVTVSWEVIEWF